MRALKTGWTHYNDGYFQAFQTGIPMVNLSVKTGSHPMLEKKNYLSKGKWEGTCLLNQTWGKETDSWWKVRIWKLADKIGRELILIILMFSLISRSSYFSSNVGNSSLWSVSVSLLPTKTRWNFEISVTSLYSQHLLDSVYVKNTSEPSICFFTWLSCRLLLNFNFVFRL